MRDVPEEKLVQTVERRKSSDRPSLVTIGIGLGMCAVALIASATLHHPGAGLYGDLVEKHAAIHRMEPELVFAMIYVESRGRPRAVSPKGAAGLMQIMPGTAKDMALRLKMPPPTAETLFDPDVNIHLGTAYMARLLKRYDNDLFLSLGAYNAGPRKVDKWRRENPEMNSEELCSKVYYRETRNYVGSVIRRKRVLTVLKFMPGNTGGKPDEKE